MNLRFPFADTNLTEQVMGLTRTDEFNIALEIQQSPSNWVLISLRTGVDLSPVPTDLIAGVDLATQENSIRDLINLEAPVRSVLRLLCVYSLVSGGLKQKVLEEFKRDLLQASPRLCVEMSPFVR